LALPSVKAERRFLIANVSTGKTTLCRGQCGSIGPVLENDHDTSVYYYYYYHLHYVYGQRTIYVIYKNWM